MDKITAVLTIFLLVNLSTTIVNADKCLINIPISKEKNNINSLFQQHLQRVNNFVFSPEDLELIDDAFHGSSKFGFVEWWYFDAMLNKGYSIEVNIHFFSLAYQVFIVVAKINIYKDGISQVCEKKYYPPADFYVSKDKPLIELDGKQVMKGYIDNSGNLVYNLFLSINEVSVDLKFVGNTKGWKGVTPLSGWGVFLPSSKVTGNINLDGENISVNGNGYHDHNWNFGLKAGINFGWYWGKVNTNNYSITWSQILKTRFQNQPLLVINEKNGSYLNILPKDIPITVGDIHFKNGFLIPMSFNLEVQSEQCSIKLKIVSLKANYVRLLGLINYWKYHVKCSGSLNIGSEIEIIDDLNMVEFMRVRR